MNSEVTEYIKKYPDGIVFLFEKLRSLVTESAAEAPEEKLWAKLPSYYVGESFVRLIPFKDHINIEAAAMLRHADELSGYKLTPKGMLQLRLSDELPEDVLRRVFAETLGRQ